MQSQDRGEHSEDELWVCRLGTVPYLDAVAIQQQLWQLRLAEEVPDTLLLLEHPPVYTRGRRRVRTSCRWARTSTARAAST